MLFMCKQLGTSHCTAPPNGSKRCLRYSTPHVSMCHSRAHHVVVLVAHAFRKTGLPYIAASFLVIAVFLTTTVRLLNINHNEDRRTIFVDPCDCFFFQTLQWKPSVFCNGNRTLQSHHVIVPNDALYLPYCSLGIEQGVRFSVFEV